jgi:hypothetical protein
VSVASAPPAVPEVQHPFGLPMGTVRGVLALLICGFVWLVLLWPTETKLPLAHFFLGSMVFMAFVSHPALPTGAGKSVAPWVLRVLFAGGSIGVVAYAVYTDWESVTKRLVPDVDEFRGWWLMFLGVTVGGFLVGRLFRLALGNANPFFQSLRAWLSVLALLMIAGEYLLFIAFNSAADRPDAFMHAWHGVELAAVSAYFGSRA